MAGKGKNQRCGGCPTDGEYKKGGGVKHTRKWVLVNGNSVKNQRSGLTRTGDQTTLRDGPKDDWKGWCSVNKKGQGKKAEKEEA